MKKWFGVFLILFGGLMLIRSLTNINFGGWSTGATTQSEASSSIDNIDTIKIDLTNAYIQVIPEDRSDLSASLQGNSSKNYHLQIDQHQRTLEITAEDTTSNWFTFNNDLKLRVYVPLRFQQNLQIETESGVVELGGDSKDSPAFLKELSLSISSGDVRLHNLKLDTLKIESTSGSIRTDWIQANESSLDVTSGYIRMNHYAGAFDAEVTSGSLDMQMDELTGPVRVEATSGEVKLQLPQNADVTVDAKVTSGTVKSDFPLAKTTYYDEDKGIQGSNGAGTYPVYLEAVSGSIKIR